MQRLEPEVAAFPAGHRIGPAPDAISETNSETAIYYGGGSTTGGQSTTMSSAFVIEQQKQQLFGICEMVQSNIGTLMDQIARIASGIGQQQGKPKELLAEYEFGAWPILVDVDSQVKLLSKTLRQTIDSCNINEPRLSWLLAVNKFQVKIEKMLDNLINKVAPDIERLLSLRVRCDIIGLELKKETIEAIRQMHAEIRSNGQ